ncbi:hypothetical protein HPB50_028652 [Hyalomma asiaticum]|nr:hypothetical protein HPB50_028652 [Hyalomma asiaticum]
MVGRNRVFPYTFFGRLPAGTTNVDVCVALVKTFKRTDLLCVQDFGAGRFEVTFKNKESVDRFLAHPVIELKGSECKFEYRGVQTKVVRVFGFPKLEDAGLLAREMANYGKVLGVSEEYIPGWPEVLSGIRRVRIEMIRSVPNLLRVEDKVVMYEYEGVVRFCRRCSLPGHHAAECETPKCERCGKFGHQTCSAACTRCGGDHGVFSCRVRTFASVATRAPTRGEAGGVPAESEQNFPTLERPPQPKGPAPGEKVSDKGGEKSESGLAEAVPSPAAEVVPASPANEAAVYRPEYTQNVLSSGRCSVSDWGAISKDGLGPLVRIEGTFNASSYCDIVKETLVPYAQDGPFPDGFYWLQHDRSPVHTARLAEAALDSCGVLRLPWPPSGADLNPIENVWGLLKRRLAAQSRRLPNADALWSAIQEAWEALSREPETSRALYASMPRRIAEVIAAEGHYTGH